MDKLFFKEKKCLLCGAKFISGKVKRSKQYMLKRDSDFCIHYRGENPAFYNVYVCPQCGYGFTDNFTPPKEKEILNLSTTKVAGF